MRHTFVVFAFPFALAIAILLGYAGLFFDVQAQNTYSIAVFNEQNRALPDYTKEPFHVDFEKGMVSTDLKPELGYLPAKIYIDFSRGDLPVEGGNAIFVYTLPDGTNYIEWTYIFPSTKFMHYITRGYVFDRVTKSFVFEQEKETKE